MHYFPSKSIKVVYEEQSALNRSAQYELGSGRCCYSRNVSGAFDMFCINDVNKHLQPAFGQFSFILIMLNTFDSKKEMNWNTTKPTK